MIADDAFPVEPWQVRETQLDLDMLAQTESLFALSNGHIGLRGNLDEGEPYGLPGTYLNGFYETRPLPYAEAGFGYPEDGQTDRRRHQRQDHPAAGRGRAVRRPLRRIARARTGSGPARRHPGAHGAVDVASGQAGRACGRPGWCPWRIAAWPPSSTSSRRSTNSSLVTVQSELVANEDQPERSGRPAGGGPAVQSAGGGAPRNAPSTERCWCTGHATAA